jgi:uncharacterized protein YktA (UPF0223 family)
MRSWKYGEREPKTCKELLLIAVIFYQKKIRNEQQLNSYDFYRNVLSNKSGALQLCNAFLLAQKGGFLYDCTIVTASRGRAK